MPVFEPPGSGELCPEHSRESAAATLRLQYVFDQKGRIFRLLEKIGSGRSGEGDVYLDPHGCCIKVFRPHVDTATKQKKAEALIRAAVIFQRQRSILAKQAAFPASVVYADAARTQPVGYRMRHFADYVPLDRIDGRRSRADTGQRLQLAASVAALAAAAEKDNLILADVLSFQNVLYDPVRFQAALIDTDSTGFTTNGTLFACTVGREQMCSPEHIGGGLSYCRTSADDWWSLQILLFHILAGCEPYIAPGSSSSYSESVRGGRYGFPASAPAGGDIPLYMRQWVKLPHCMQQAFFSAFSANGATFTAEKRRDANFWKELCDTAVLQYQTLNRKDL